MDALVLQVEPATRSSFKEYGPWHFRDQRYAEVGHTSFGDTCLHMFPAAHTEFVEVTPANQTTGYLGTTGKVDEEPLRRCQSTASTDPDWSQCGLPSPSTPTVSGSMCSSGESFAYQSPFSFSHAMPPAQQVYDFQAAAYACCHKPRPSLKRRRAVSDVDGPNTASQGCKKRRLRRYMVTSRLSRPFSEPATHIINREFATSGDKRFLKLAAILSARRMSSTASTPLHHTSQPSPSSLLRRAAVINRFRLSVKERAVERGDEDVADLATNAALLQQNQGLGFIVGARFPVTSSSATLLAGPGPSGHGQDQSIPPFQLSLAAVEARPRPTSPRAKATDATRVKLPPSPRIRPLGSPVLRGVRPSSSADVEDDEGLDDQDVAFPTSEHESRYECIDEPDDVYADFGMIFGGGSVDDEPEEDGESHYEDYMDDLDGIPWTAR